VRFSNRVPSDLSESPLYSYFQKHQKDLVDLTVSNPTLCGFIYDEKFFKSDSKAENQTYHPHSQGLLSARKAVCREYCIFRRKADNDSDGKRTRIPDESGQPFRSKADNFVRLFTEFGMS
jgi:hypothetical protein